MGVNKTGTGAVKIEKEKKDDGNIVSIELLEGNTEKTDAEVIQYVNIQKDEANHVDGTDVTHIDRLGQKLRLKVKFDKAGDFRFKVELKKLGPSDTDYTLAEETRNSDFKYSKEKVTFYTDNSSEKIIEADKIFVTPAGGDIFEITATDDNGKTVTAKSKIKTKRLLYYVELTMKNIKYPPTNIGSKIEKEYAKHGIILKKLSTAVIDYSKKNLEKKDEAEFYKKAQEAFDSSSGKAKIPYCFGIAYTDQNVWRIEDTLTSNKLNVDGVVKEVIIKSDNYNLWCNVDDLSWFISGIFKKDGGGEEAIPKGACKPHSLTGSTKSYNSVKIDLSKLKSKGKGKIFLKVNLIEGIYTGDATRAIPFATTNTLGSKRGENDIARTMIHEIGHKMGLASDGGPGMPDKTPDFYLKKGRHCNKPSSCVMYGYVNGFLEFCTDCAITVKKVDLKSGIK